MLQALRPPVPSSPKAQPQDENAPRYSVTQLSNLLQLADRAMNPGIPQILKLGYHEPAVLYFLKEMDPYLKIHPNQFDDILIHCQTVLKVIEETDGLKCEINHVWARLIKYVFMNANVLNLNDMRVNFARILYIEDLKALLAKTQFIEACNPETKKMECQVKNLDRGIAQTSLYEFMGQLLGLGFESSVKALHNYLYLAKKVVNAKGSGMSAEHVAVTIAPTIHEMLLLDNVLCPVKADAKNQTAEMKKSLQFFTAIYGCLLQTTRFDTPFDPEAYKEYKQVKYQAFYQGIMTVLTDPTRLVGLADLIGQDPSLESQFKKLHIKKPPSDQTGYTCAALEASLSKKDEEPIVRTEGNRRLTKSPGSRVLNKAISAEDIENYHRSLQKEEVDKLVPATTLLFSAQSNDTSAVVVGEKLVQGESLKEKPTIKQ